MQTLQLKATLTGTVPAVWRTLAFHPETGLEQVHDMLLIVLGWDDENTPVFLTNDGPITPDDDAYYEASLNEYLVAAGDVISYSLETGDEFLVELELTAITDESEDAQLPRVIAGENAAPPENEGGVATYNEIQAALANADDPRHAEAAKEFSGVFDPRYFDATELNEEARELFHGEQDGAEFAFDIDDEGDEVIPPFVNEFDADFGNQDLPFEFDWLEEEHGIRLTEEDVRGTPPEVSTLRNALTEADLENPRGYLKRILPLYEKYPNEPMLAFDVAGLYAITGDGGKARRIMKRLERDHADNLEYTVNKLMSLQDEDEFQREVRRLPQPLAITHLAPGTDGRYHVTEFLGFEEVAIRAAVIREDLVEALQRLDRLVRFGFLHGDVEQSATAIAALQVDKMRQAVQSETPATPLKKQPELSGRTTAILEASTGEVLELMREYEERTLETVRREGPKVGRNDPCPCGSGKKFKKCCL